MHPSISLRSAERSKQEVNTKPTHGPREKQLAFMK